MSVHKQPMNQSESQSISQSNQAITRSVKQSNQTIKSVLYSISQWINSPNQSESHHMKIKPNQIRTNETKSKSELNQTNHYQAVDQLIICNLHWSIVNRSPTCKACHFTWFASLSPVARGWKVRSHVHETCRKDVSLCELIFLSVSLSPMTSWRIHLCLGTRALITIPSVRKQRQTPLEWQRCFHTNQRGKAYWKLCASQTWW